MTDRAIVWQPGPEARESRMQALIDRVGAERGRPLTGYQELHQYAIESAAAFWPQLASFSGLSLEGSLQPAIEGTAVESARFFPEVRLNYTENLLATAAGQRDDAPALVALDETGQVASLTRRELRRRVAHAAAGLSGLGVREGDRVVAVARSTAESVIACLAATALGASWSAVGPELGTEATTRRLGSLEPRLLCYHRISRQHGVERDLAMHIDAVARSLPTLAAAVALDEPIPGWDLPQARLAELVADGPAPDVRWPRLRFDHPLFILFSSGTTGAPKCIVHGTGGTLLEHWKELRLHSGLGPGDRLLFLTSCGWMMWNWQLSALACGVTLVLYDGSPTYPTPDAIWRIVADARITAFGTSPAFLRACEEAGVAPQNAGDLSALRMMFSTGSVLHATQYDWVAREVGPVQLQSISGGTDIVGCFVLGNPLLPVRRGESQCVSLGYDVRVMDGGEAKRVGTGELVCAAPFPSRPVGLFGDSDGRRFHEAYFSRHPGAWTHGDQLTLLADGGAQVLGRTDGVLNVRGIRIGPAEIYDIVLPFPEVADAMAVEQRWAAELGGSRLVLLLVMSPGTALDRALTLRIKRELATRGSPAHVPSVIAQVDELPMTHNGKRSERAATDALNGDLVRNREALRNPGVLDRLATHPLLAPTPGRPTA